MKDTDLKHLTFKTDFLLALASGKPRSKIHAWVANKVSNLGQWEALFPSSDFIAKNQLAREDFQTVSPVIISGHLIVIVDKLLRHRQVIQTEWCLHQEVFDQIWHRGHQPKIDLFATRYNNKWSQFWTRGLGPWMPSVCPGMNWIVMPSQLYLFWAR